MPLLTKGMPRSIIESGNLEDGENIMLITDKTKLKAYYTDRRVWQGIPGIAYTAKGRTFISFYSGDVKETYGNYALLLSSKDGENFGEPIAVGDAGEGYRCFDPVLWIDPKGRLWFIWNVMPGEKVCAAICKDPDADELVWSDVFCIGRGIMMNKPTVLSNGSWLFPIAVWSLDIYNEMRTKCLTADDVAGAYVYRTNDGGKTFERLGAADLDNRSFDEHMVYEKKDGALRMFVRLHTGIGESYSFDGGKTWSEGKETAFVGPSTRFCLKKLRSGNVLLIYHVSEGQTRRNLTAFLSEDDGETFPYSLLLDERNQVSYPDAIECEDGLIRIVYDRERGCFKSSLEKVYADAREIITAAITEDDIKKGSLSSADGYLKRVVCKLDRLADGIPDPFENAK